MFFNKKNKTKCSRHRVHRPWERRNNKKGLGKSERLFGVASCNYAKNSGDRQKARGNNFKYFGYKLISCMEIMLEACRATFSFHILNVVFD